MSSLSTVIKNMEQTIHGKEVLLNKWKSMDVSNQTIAVKFARSTAINFIELNLTELRAILKDLRAIPEPSGQLI